MVDLSAIRWKPHYTSNYYYQQTNNNKSTAVYLCKKAMRPTIAVIVTVTVKVAQAGLVNEAGVLSCTVLVPFRPDPSSFVPASFVLKPLSY